MTFQVLLTCAHADASVAAWLRSRASAYRTPRSLIGTRSPQGPVPARLKLTAARQVDPADLEESRALIVVCSAAAAADADVNHDIDKYIALGRTRRIVPVIVPSAPDTQDVQRDYFPSAISGRGLFTVDLREQRVGDTLSGDGREGGWMKLVAELLGVDLARLAQHEARRSATRNTVLTIALAAAAFAAMGAATFGVRELQRGNAIEAERELVAGHAMRALQLQREAVAAAEQQANQEAAASQEFNRAKATLLASVRDYGTLAGAILDEIGESRTTNPASARKLSVIERTYWELGDVSPYFEIPPSTLTTMMERISAIYTQLGHSDDAHRVDARLTQFGERIVRNRRTSPSWRTAYAAAVIAISDHRGANGDDAGKAAALEQAGRIYEDVCLATPAGAQTAAVSDTRASSCLRFANIVLARAAQQRDAAQRVDVARLERAKIVLAGAIAAFSNNAGVQSRAPRLQDQIDKAVEAANAPATQAAAAHE
ncbi:MAG: hypothetical protein QM759_07440 [Terricaulis sp.]